MAIIKESSDEEPNVIRKMIDGIGIQNTIKMVGNYDLIRPYLKNIDKINFIKDFRTKVIIYNYIFFFYFLYSL